MGPGCLNHSSLEGWRRRERPARVRQLGGQFPRPPRAPPHPWVSLLVMPASRQAPVRGLGVHLSALYVVPESEPEAGEGPAVLQAAWEQHTHTVSTRLPGDEPRGRLSPGTGAWQLGQQRRAPCLPSSRPLLNAYPALRRQVCCGRAGGPSGVGPAGAGVGGGGVRLPIHLCPPKV